MLADGIQKSQNHCSEACQIRLWSSTFSSRIRFSRSQQVNPAIPEGLAQLVHRALEKTADKRFVSAAEMHQQLRAFAK